MEIYINDGIWCQVINNTVITAIISDDGTLLAYKAKSYSSNRIARQVALNTT